jgi:hypothetical protein
VTIHSAALSGLAASTSYQFRVRSTDAGGNTAVSVNSSFTTTVQSGGGIPSALGWFQVPNSSIRPLCPSYSDIQGASGCASVMSAWSGGLFDTKRNRLIITGGGHTDYFGNEIYAIDLTTNPVSKVLVKDASHGAAISNVTSCPEGYNDGTMDSRHNYGGLAYLPTKDLYMLYSGSRANCGFFENHVWTFNPATLAWSHDFTGSGGPDFSHGGVPDVAYDLVTDSVYALNIGDASFWRYDLTTHTFALLANQPPVCNTSNITAVVDPVRRIYLCIGAGAFSKISLNTPYAASNLSGSGCSTLIGTAAPGFAYDPVQKLMVGWAGGNTAYLYNPDTDSCTTTTFSGGPTTIQGNGTYGRFQYSPASGVFVVVNDVDSNVYSLRLTP